MHKRVLEALRQPSLKLTIIAIVFVVLVPTLGVVSATLYSSSRSFHDAGTRQLLETARTVAQSAISELELTGSVLQSLTQFQLDSEESALRDHSVSSFANGRLENHVLIREDGQWRLGRDDRTEPLVRDLVRKAAQSGQLQVSDILMPSTPDQRMQVVLAMPGYGTQTTLQVATLVTEPQHLLHALSRGGERNLSVILAITDGQGRIIERSVDSQRFVGKPVPDWQTVKAHPAERGSFTAKTLEGQQIIFAFQRIEGTPGWVAVVGEAADSFNQRWQKPMWVMLSASAITIFLALLLAMLLARKALQPIRVLATRAQRIAAGQHNDGKRLMADVPPSFVAEFEVLRQSLDLADQTLQKSLQESQRAAHEAQEHLAVLQAAEEQARLGHWTLDVASGQLNCSDMLAVLSGGPRQSTVMHMGDLQGRMKGSSYERMQAAVQRCVEKGEAYALEIEHLRRDGSSFAAYLRGAPVFDAHGRVVAIQGTLQDISEGKEQSDRLTALADNLPSGVIFRVQRTADKGLLLQFLSAGLEGLTGLSATGLLQNAAPLLKAIAPAHLRRLLRVLRGAQEPGQVLDEQFALRSVQGQEIWIHCRAALRYPRTGGAVWDGIARDVTSERAADEALRAAKNAAEVAERAKSDFLATMSHEIRTPMNSVIGMARLAMRTPLDPRQRNYLEKINESANVLLGIINDILDFSKIEAGGLVLEGVPFRIDSVLDTVASVTVLKAEEKGLEITYAVEPDVPSVVRGDALRLAQVLTNLVTNAVKFTETGDVVVRVSVRPDGEGSAQGPMLHFAVSDTGIGLSAEQASRLFQPFTQAQADTSRRYGGTGLGLAISKRLVEMMGGSIGVHSAQGVGSTFFFTIALQAVNEDEAELHAPQPRTMSLRGRRILIADDNNTSRMALAEMAENFGMHPTLAADGKEAIELLRQHAGQGENFDVVMLDWRMPVVDGVEAARQIRADAQLERMPAVLMVTAYSQEAMLQACNGVAVQGVLHKPVTHSSMYNTLLRASAAPGAPAMLGGNSGYQPSDLSAFAALEGKRVLVADDNALNREVAVDFLACVGVQACTAVDGLDAIRCLQAQEVDVVLMDIHMPHMDGLAATREIRRHARWAQLPIIALTAQARSEDVKLSLEAGMNGHLTKPIDEVALYRTLLEYTCNQPAAALPAGTPVAEPLMAEDAAQDALWNTKDVPFARLSRSPARRAQLLGGFLQDFEGLPQAFNEALLQSRWLDVASLAHKIKGSASYLHATALCAVADAIEVAARGGETAVVHEHAEQFVAEVHACLDAVRAALQHLQAELQTQEQGSAAPPGIDRQAIVALVERVRPLVRSGNFAAHQLLEELVAGAHQQTWVASAQDALEAFDDLDSERALASLDAILQQC